MPENLIHKYIFLDLDVEIAKERENMRNEKSNRLDIQGIKFFNKARKGYKKEIKKYPHKIIDASQSIEKVFELLKAEIK